MKVYEKKQEILRIYRWCIVSLPPPLFLSSSWFPVTRYGQFALPVCKELNVCMQLENFVCL